MSINRNRKKASKYIGNRAKVGNTAMARLETCSQTGDCTHCFPHGPETRSGCKARKIRHERRRQATPTAYDEILIHELYTSVNPSIFDDVNLVDVFNEES